MEYPLKKSLNPGSRSVRTVKRNLLLLFLAWSFVPLLASEASDSLCGIYLDGVKVNEINCYSFGTMTLVMPYNKAYENYSKIVIGIYSSYNQDGLVWNGHSYQEITATNSFKYIRGNYIVYEIFSKGSQAANGDYSSDGSVTRSKMQYQTINDGPDFMVQMQGLTISGYAEYYDQGCQCFRKDPTYDYDQLFSEEIVMNNRIKYKNLFKPEPDVDLSQACDVTGTKVDLTKIGSVNQQGAGQSGTVSDGLTPYSEMYDNGKIKVKGQKNANGEQEGEWKYFDESGKLERTENYSGGVANGEWKYYKDGKLVKTETYKDGEVIGTKNPN